MMPEQGDIYVRALCPICGMTAHRLVAAVNVLGYLRQCDVCNRIDDSEVLPFTRSERTDWIRVRKS